MPMVACPDCNTQISDRAERCPRCGRPGAVQATPTQAVTLTDVHIPFMSLFGLILKATIAAIPAAIVLSMITLVGMSFLIAALGGLGAVAGGLSK